MKSELEQFVDAYIEAALWSSYDDNDDPLDDNYDRDSIELETLNKMERDCKIFFDVNYEDIKSNISLAGHDFWLTRNGHGCGFWDGDWPEEIGDRLTEAAEQFSTYDLWVSDGTICGGW